MAFDNYLEALPAILQSDLFPPSILNDINLLYSYTEEEFIIRGIPVIENMIYNVLTTPIGSREFEPTFGSRMLIMIHEQLIKQNMDILDMELFAAVKRWVPYCRLLFRQTYCIGYPDQQLVVAYINYVDVFHQLPRSFSVKLAGAQLG